MGRFMIAMGHTSMRRGMIEMKNVYWEFLENLRRSGETNMFGATPYLQAQFGLSHRDAMEILADWMNNYNPEDYE